MSNSKYNQSHCKDLTAHQAIKNVTLEEKRAMELIGCLKFIIRNSGFELTERIQIKDKRTGRVFK